MQPYTACNLALHACNLALHACNFALHATLHCMQATLHCMQPYTACNLTLHATLHCMQPCTACNLALHATLHCMQPYTALFCLQHCFYQLASYRMTCLCFLFGVCFYSTCFLNVSARVMHCFIISLHACLQVFSLPTRTFVEAQPSILVRIPMVTDVGMSALRRETTTPTGIPHHGG